MSTALKTDTSEPVIAPVQFTKKDHVTPVALVHVEGEGADDRTGNFDWRDIVIHDARPMIDQLDLDRQGYDLVHFETAVQDFYDREEVERVYYPEMEALIKRETGASRVVIFDHTPRIDNTAAQDADKVRGPATVVHNDFTIQSAEQRVRDLFPADQAEALLAKRFGSINVWRPIRGPVENAPLMICGWDDIADEDLIVSERHYPGGRVGRIYHVAYNPTQSWFYFPHMQRDEVVLLKCYDSLEDGTARWTAHGSFQMPSAGPDTPPRESIEIRSMIFWD
jgi:hypothetical protein